MIEHDAFVVGAVFEAQHRQAFRKFGALERGGRKLDACGGGAFHGVVDGEVLDVTNDVTLAAPYSFVSLATSALAVAAPASAVSALTNEKWPIGPPATTSDTVGLHGEGRR